jgi:enoyl-CoA hydratase/carnithine racemase
MEIARRLSSFTPESLAYIKRLVRNATETPLAQGLALERDLFLKLCITEPALARMRSYREEDHLAVPLFRGLRRVNHG